MNVSAKAEKIVVSISEQPLKVPTYACDPISTFFCTVYHECASATAQFQLNPNKTIDVGISQ